VQRLGVLLAAVAATQAEQESASATNRAVTPGRQQYHPSAAKAWCFADTGGTATLAYNVSSVTDVGTGRAGFNFTTSFSTASYCAGCSPRSPNTSAHFSGIENTSVTASRCDVYVCISTTGALADPNNFYFWAFGDQ
jgi:hypothetical protein